MNLIVSNTVGRALRIAGLVALACVSWVAPARAQEQQPPPATAPAYAPADASQLSVVVNTSIVVNAKSAFRRVNVAAPDIADVNVLSATSLLVTGKKPGSTQIILWDDAEHSMVYQVFVHADITGLQQQLKSIFPALSLDVYEMAGQVAVRGRVPSLTIAQQILDVAKPYAKTVQDMLEISGGQQVMLRVRFAEVSRSASSALGVNFATAVGHFAGGSNVGGVNPTALLPQSGNVGVEPPFNGVALLPPAVAGGVTLYGAEAFNNIYLENFIQALRENSLERTLAEPNLLAISGQEASFLAGGSFPIPVVQSGSTSGGITIQYEQYGVKLVFTPIVLGDGHIRLKVAPEVSALDFADGVTLNGFVVPAVTIQNLSTTVELADGQTFALAGLLNNTVTATKDVTPLLGDLPVVGALFRSVRYQRQETELVVLVTPRLVEPLNPGEAPPLPGQEWRHPTEHQLFFNQDLGGPVSATPPGTAVEAAATRHAPQFHGDYGFTPATGGSEQAAVSGN